MASQPITILMMWSIIAVGTIAFKNLFAKPIDQGIDVSSSSCRMAFIIRLTVGSYSRRGNMGEHLTPSKRPVFM